MTVAVAKPGVNPERVLTVEDLSVSIRPQDGERATVVRRARLEINRGEMVGLVGESGSGKTMLSRAIAGLLVPGLQAEVTGSIMLQGRDIATANAGQRRMGLRRDMSYVFQDPNAHLNPTMRIGAQVAEAIGDSGRTVEELFGSVGLPTAAEFARSYPHQLSGGMKQRVVIAIALAKGPALVIADEPTTALDVTIQAQVLSLLQRLAREEQVGILLVSHDLAVIGQVCSRISVMRSGDIVEAGAAEDVLWRPQHPYTQSLMAAMRHLYDTGMPARDWSDPPIPEADESGVTNE
ncbi:ABC transporter ATP-binding protein [Nakamurella lactea]|uniref:ABC transporter ATP-binding protein n=1 Tax=Nakamurella lactea TaxID=459515 RepID=UPI00040F11DF|nr:ABC transporter ATP-binding protein [Nakamurella lactea]